MALAIGAMPTGHWSGCHATEWDMNAPPFGDLTVGDSFQKHNYPFCIYINAKGERFVDEGADFHTFTYAKYGREVLNQPGQFAWQVFDQKVTHLLREDYRIKRITKAQADTLRGTGEQAGRRRRPQVPRDGQGFQRGAAARRAFRSQHPRRPVHAGTGDQQVELGVAARQAALSRLWRDLRHHLHVRRPEDQHASPRSRIRPNEPIPGLYAAGELVGGLYYHNYGSGSGLMSGAVFGRIAGREAAAFVKTR